MLSNLLIKILGGVVDVGGSIIRQRVLNKHTPKGVVLLLSGSYFFKYLDENQVNFLMQLLGNIQWSLKDLYFIIFNAVAIFLLAMGMWLIFAKVKQEVNKI
jgi:hypothetical protein